MKYRGKEDDENLHIPKSNIGMTERSAYNTNPSFTRQWRCYSDLLNSQWRARLAANCSYSFCKQRTQFDTNEAEKLKLKHVIKLSEKVIKKST